MAIRGSLRNIKLNNTSFWVNLMGLSIGLACVLIIFLWVQDELSINGNQKKDSQLYQVLYNIETPDGLLTFEFTHGPLAQTLKEEMPEVEFATSVVPTSGKFGGDGILSFKGKDVRAGGLFADKNYFNVFTVDMLQGDINKQLHDKNEIVISAEMARKLFQGTGNAIGKTVDWEHDRFKRTLTISGVFENYPVSSTVRPDLIFNYDLYLDIDPRLKQWGNLNPTTFLILQNGTNIDDFNKKIAGFVETRSKGLNISLFVQQFSKRYLYGQFENGKQVGGRIVYVKLFSVIALFILIIACVNFMNLSTAKASAKLKEVGIRKAIGSGRTDLILRFLRESLTISFIALIIAAILIAILLPQINKITGKQLHLALGMNTILYAFGITFFTGLFSGIYPALYISGFSPVSVLKGRLKSSLSELWIRKGLVILQFSLSVIFIIGFIVLKKQTDLIQKKNLGYSRDHVLSFKKKGELTNNFQTFMSELRDVPGVVHASSMFGSIVNGFGATTDITWDGQTEDQKMFFPNQEVSYDFIETLGLEMIEGRSFSSEFGDENKNLIFNEAAVKMMGMKDPVGKSVKLWGDNWQIIGVVKDFNFESLYKKIEPCFFRFTTDGSSILVKIKAGEELATIRRLGELYKSFNPKYPFEFRFLDDDYQALYESEIRMASLSRYFAGIAILISCMGLFVLSTYSTERRIKEIGVRKVNGARVTEVIAMLNKDFIKWVVISFVIATPIAYYILNRWLSNFAYKTELSWWIFALAGVLALAIALLTVSWQSWKAATKNPIQALRYE